METQKINSIDHQQMILIPAGVFIRGSDLELDLPACCTYLPEETLYLDEFWIYKTEVTNRQFVDFLNEIGFDPETDSFDGWEPQPDGRNPVLSADGTWTVAEEYNNFPVQMSYPGAVGYCNWAGGRLPTGAEWEKAARGTDGRSYPWGNELDESCEVSNNWNCSLTSLPVGSLPRGASPYGILDMVGNLGEWVEGYFEDSDWVRPVMGTSYGQPVQEVFRIAGYFWKGGYYGDVGFRCVVDQ